jgi:O-antigen/teichoic acid export membrane protein
MSKPKELMNRLRSPLFRNTLWTFIGQIVSLIIQATYFIIIARSLGPSAYGAMVSTSAMAMIFMPFVSLGTGALMLKHVSRDAATFPERFGNTLLVTLLSGILLTTLDLYLSRWTLSGSFTRHFILVIFISDILAFRFMEVCRQAFQAVHRMALSSLVQIFSTAFRLIAALLMLKIYAHPTAAIWANFYFASSLAAALITIVMVWMLIGGPKLNLSLIWPEFAEGIYFAVAYSALTIYNDIDKTMVGKLSTLEAAGLYGAAYRILEVGFVPVRSLLLTTLPRFFSTGVKGLRSTLVFARRIIGPALGYSALATIALIVGAPYLPYVLGHSYAKSSEALQWLAPILMLRVVHQILGDALTGADLQKVRTIIMIGVALFNVVINFWLIPLYSWRGAAWASLLSDGALALTLAAYAAIMLKRTSVDSVYLVTGDA